MVFPGRRKIFQANDASIQGSLDGLVVVNRLRRVQSCFTDSPKSSSLSSCLTSSEKCIRARV